MAQVLKCANSAVWRYIKEGGLPARVMSNKQAYITRSALMAWFGSMEPAKPARKAKAKPVHQPELSASPEPVTVELPAALESVALAPAPAAPVWPPADLIIVSRHRGAVEWLARHGITGQVYARATDFDIRDKVIFGVIPLDKASLARDVYLLRVPHLGGVDFQELSADDLDDRGAFLVHMRAEILDTIRF